MSARSDVPPETVGVDLVEGGVYVEYADGRRTFYNGVPQPREGGVRCQPGKEVHVLLTDGTEGVMVYVNDRKTSDEILESTGVGRVMLAPGETEELFPGVTVRADGYAIEVEADPGEADARVFVFEEDELGERSFELV
ncbi:MAG: DUF5796 family protein [Halobacteriaceae archaeon]